ncbi:putative C-type lectin domain family 20 member A [Anabas testudineus]|uniref:putative C-type lectin domain family 20 member A n=1 Tax=Anabas testudineus TaxID=64144 RepID=UPI000E45EF53|nr:putative C-type lectin domain family 20 member A [Anabas testudineus]
MQRSLFLFILMGQSFFFTCQLYVYHFIGENKTWDEAQQYCREKYTDLATVSNMTDMERLRKSTETLTDAWIGLHSYPGKDNRTWYWSLPGLEFSETQTRWDSGEPNDKGENNHLENCVMKNQKWNDYCCYGKLKFICYDETKQSNKTFHLINYTLTWPQAQRYCRDNYTDLVSGLDQLDDDSVKNENWMWIGVFRDTWRWSDGRNFSFRNWEYVEDLVDGQSNKTCATTVLNRAGKWSSADCNEEKPFFCYDEPVPLRKHLVRLTLSAENPSVNMNDPAVINIMLKQLENKFRDEGVSVKLSWRKFPEIQNNIEAQREEQCAP